MSSALVEAARVYVKAKTRFRHRGRSPRGVDCAGLVWLAYADLGVVLPDVTLYPAEPVADGLLAGAVTALGNPVPLDTMQPGDVVVMRFDLVPHHVAIVGDYVFGGCSLIHADGHPNVRQVIEHRLDSESASRILQLFRRPV